MIMSKLVFILGGARSGKSSYAHKLAQGSGKSVTFIATAQALDEEMSTRIKKHQEDRPANWITLEIPFNISKILRANPIKTDVVLLDCITLLVNNLFMQYVENDIVDEKRSMQAMQKEVDDLLAFIHEQKQDWLIISNEVGLGVVPAYQMGRAYRDILGWANERLAYEADEVYWMVAGIPVPIGQFKK
jgi:adenosylcobinamide kinase / adenosylcobinamide-phosphate guanylyltransferase